MWTTGTPGQMPTGKTAEFADMPARLNAERAELLNGVDNRDVVHLVMPDDSCHYNSFIFPDYFLKFYSESPAGILVAKIVGHPQIPIFAFKEKTPGATGFYPPSRRLFPLKTAKQNFMYMKCSCNYLPYGLKYRKISSCALSSRPQGGPVMSIHACRAF